MNIEDVEGIGPVHATSLRAIGVTTTDALLERGATAAGRADLADTAGVTPTLILEWVNHVDLMRIDGVGSEYSDLLEAAGVDSPAELAQRNAANLAQTFQELDAARPNWIRSLPSQAMVEGWIEQAKTLPKIVTHGGGGESAPAADPAPVSARSLAPEPAPGPAPAPAADPAPAPIADAPPVDVAAASAEPAPLAAPAATPAAGRNDEGLWARIKRIFGA